MTKMSEGKKYTKSSQAKNMPNSWHKICYCFRVANFMPSETWYSFCYLRAIRARSKIHAKRALHRSAFSALGFAERWAARPPLISSRVLAAHLF